MRNTSHPTPHSAPLPTLLLITAVFLLSACAKPKEGSNAFADPNDDPNQKTVNDTNTSACEFGQSPSHLDGGRWQLLLRNDKVRFTMNFEFSNGRLWMSNTCTYSTHSVTAYVSSPYSEKTPGVFTIENEISKTEKGADGFGRTASCTATLKRGATRFAFRGPCLVLKATGSEDDTVLVPTH